MQKSYYFQHDYNAASDTKILFLRQQLGMEGYGIFWFIIEQLAMAGGKMPMKIIPVLAMQAQTQSDKVLAVIKNYELFVFDQEDFFASERLNEQLDYRKMLSVKGREGINKRWGNSPPISLPTSTPDTKERKGKESKVKNTNTEYNLSLNATKKLEDREKDFLQTINAFQELYTPQLLEDFFDYWREPNKSRTKMKFEMQKTWDLKLRLKTWERNSYKPKMYGISTTGTSTKTRQQSKEEAFRNW